ncbi:hypothetical protein ATY78_03935 [Rhizobium sp. R635]|uniref:hypothetical protein n=1 Tax=Rhizobium sp. R635 TaxID=1764275 RepID=UPI000B532ECF|nr:hypothetical protein [Rhizobium sp. R635]OWV87656.1 hypothetical protein ATY78_03935 [Rhizobium sp. R635]
MAKKDAGKDEKFPPLSTTLQHLIVDAVATLQTASAPVFGALPKPAFLPIFPNEADGNGCDLSRLFPPVLGRI